MRKCLAGVNLQAAREGVGALGLENTKNQAWRRGRGHLRFSSSPGVLGADGQTLQDLVLENTKNQAWRRGKGHLRFPSSPGILGADGQTLQDLVLENT